METLLIVLITLVSITLLLLVIFTILFLVGLTKAMKQVRIASEKVQESADSAAELVDEVRSAVVNPGIIAMLFEKYLKKRFDKGSKK